MAQKSTIRIVLKNKWYFNRLSIKPKPKRSNPKRLAKFVSKKFTYDI